MRSLTELAPPDVSRLRGLVFDLDGTVFTDGALTLEAYGALFALREQGLRLIACTGRPAGWAAMLARQWPLDLAVSENGALAFRQVDTRLDALDALAPSERRARRVTLDAIVASLCSRFPEIPLADDNQARRSDVTFDVRETRETPPFRVAALRVAAHEMGARTFESSIHVHVTLDVDDKASGTVRALSRVFGEDASSVLDGYAFVGDSANDESCFSAFRTTFGVANVMRWAGTLSVPPQFVASLGQGAGFAELARRLIELRRRAS